MLPLRLNPALDPAPFARTYAANTFVQVPNLFEDDVADALERALLAVSWRLLVQDEQRKNVLLTQDDLAKMSTAERQALEARIRETAAGNFGYTYYAYPLLEARNNGWDKGNPIHALVGFLNSAPFIAFAQKIIDCPDVKLIDAHGSNYQRGHYLVRHVDEGARQERRAAYTIGFSRGWQADWGGLLLFYDDKQDVTQGFVPRFNVLTVFDGMREHAVSSIAPFAPRGRISVAGWFRDR
ncbi:MAG: 2OG-Fe(II) oxygenase family protein [Hyphomonadaceae bacterium]